VQIRNQRNRFVALIATARQAATEMTDRLRLLSSEQEILTAEVATKAQLLDKVMHTRECSAQPFGGTRGGAACPQPCSWANTQQSGKPHTFALTLLLVDVGATP
jgi:hypothetical protein